MLRLPHLLLLLGTVAFLSSGKASKAFATDNEAIQGVWKFTESWDNGKHKMISLPLAVRFSQDHMEYGKLIEGRFHSEETPVRFRFELDPSKSPKHLNTEIGPRVYSLERDTFVICGFSSDSKDQPRNNQARPTTAPEKGANGDGLWIGVFKRVQMDHAP